MKEKNKNINPTTKEIIDIMKNGMGEKIIVEFFLSLNKDEEQKVTSIGYVKDMESEYKNEFFDEIYEDENGCIVDIRIYENKPTNEEMFNLAEYWNELHFKFKKEVIPHFVIS